MRYGEPLKFLTIPDNQSRVTGNYWKPNPQFISELSQFLQGRKVLEIFAGNGYLAALLAANGIEVTATTILSSHDAHELGLYHQVEDIDAVKAVQQYGATHDVLLICWPTTTNAVLHAVEAWGNRDFVFIGEITNYSKNHLGGCATDEFFERTVFTKKFDTYQPDSAMESALVGQLEL